VGKERRRCRRRRTAAQGGEACAAGVRGRGTEGSVSAWRSRDSAAAATCGRRWNGVQAAAQWMHGRGVRRRFDAGAAVRVEKKEHVTDARGPQEKQEKRSVRPRKP